MDSGKAPEVDSEPQLRHPRRRKLLTITAIAVLVGIVAAQFVWIWRLESELGDIQICTRYGFSWDFSTDACRDKEWKPVDLDAL